MRPILISALALVLAALAASASEAQPRWSLVEDLRIGGEEDGEMALFTDIRSIVAGPQGHIFVLDARQQDIRVFDHAGKFVTIAAREGQGPGELAADANGLLLVRDTVWVNDPGGGRFSAFSASSAKYLRQITIPILSHGWLWGAGIDAEGRIVNDILVPGRGPDGQSGYERKLERVRTDGRIVDTIPYPSCNLRNVPAKASFTGTRSGPRGGGGSMAVPFLPRPILVLDGRGGAWCSPNDEYLLVHRRLGRPDTLHSVRMSYTRLPVTKAERERAVDEAKKFLSRYDVVDVDYSVIPALHPVFDRLDTDDKGQLWARRTSPAGAPLTFDVFDAAARKVATVSTTIPFVPGRPLHIRSDRVYGVVNDAEEVPYVVRARIVQGGTGGAR